MTRLTKPVSRATLEPLGHAFGPDSDKPLVVTIIPGNGEDVKAMFELRPLRSRGRAERITIQDCYSYAMRCRVNLAVLEKARTTKAAKALKRESRRIKAEERKLFRQQ